MRPSPFAFMCFASSEATYISALDVNVNDLVEHIVLAVDQQAGAADTGVVEQAVDLAESLNALPQPPGLS